MIQCVHKWWSSLYQKENQKNVKYNLTVDNKAQYYNVTKNLQRAILMSEVTFKIFVNDNDKLKWQVHLSDFIFSVVMMSIEMKTLPAINVDIKNSYIQVKKSVVYILKV